MSRTVYIYGLMDPRDYSVRYIGRTVNLANRLSWHNSTVAAKSPVGKWIKELAAEELTPWSFVICETTREQGDDIERATILQYLDAGCSLLNRSTPLPIPAELGRVYGQLTVIDLKGVTSSGRHAVVCRCSCGRDRFVELKALHSKVVTACDTCSKRGARRGMWKQMYRTRKELSGKLGTYKKFKDAQAKTSAIGTPSAYEYELMRELRDLES